jgi:ketosteroid isomerase-like protein
MSIEVIGIEHVSTWENVVTEEKKKEIALTFLTALQTRNAADLRSVLTDDAVWSLPGTSAVAGEAKGLKLS